MQVDVVTVDDYGFLINGTWKGTLIELESDAVTLDDTGSHLPVKFCVEGQIEVESPHEKLTLDVKPGDVRRFIFKDYNDFIIFKKV